MAIGDIKAGRAYVEIVAQDKMTSTLDSIGAKFKTFGSVVAVGFAAVSAAVAAALPYINQATDELSAVADAANRIGASAAGIIGLQRAAQLGGSSAEDMLSAMDKLQKRLASGEIDKRLAAIGLSAKDLKSLSLDEAVLQIADAVRNLSTEGEQAAAMYDLFGRSGQALTVTLKAGSEELRRQIKEARDLGLVVEGETLDSVEGMGDAWDDAKLAGSGFWRQLTGALAPALHVVADAGTELLTDGAAITKSFNEQALASEKLDAKMRQLAKDREAVAAAGKQIDTGDTDLKRIIAQSEFAKNDPTQEWRNSSIDALQDFTKGLQQEIDMLGKSSREVELYRLSKMLLMSTEVQEARALAARLEGLEQEKKAREEAAKAAEEHRQQMMAEAAEIVQATRNPAELFRAGLEQAVKLRSGGFLDEDSYSRRVAQLRRELASATTQAGRTSSAAGTFNPAAVRGLSDSKKLTELAQKQVDILQKIADRTGARVFR